MATASAKALTLTQAASTLRKVILVSGIMLVVLIVGRIFLDAIVSYWAATHPTPPPPPTVGFGILPKLTFPQSAINPTNFSQQIPSQLLAPPSDRAAVFFMPTKRPSLLAVDKAKEQASALKFLIDPERITDEMYRWRRTIPLPAVLDYNIVNGTFTMRVNWQNDPAFLQGNRLPTEDNAISLVKQTIASAGLLPADMATGSAKVTYLKANDSSYANTVSFSEADFLQVDLFRTPVYGKYQVLTEKPTKGTIRAIVSGNNDPSSQLVGVDYSYLPVEYATPQTYPIITPSQAYQLLAAGKGYSASIADGDTNAVIRNVYLAYFDSGSTVQAYLQPIYVFEGDGGYVGYVPAIDPKWISPQ